MTHHEYSSDSNGPNSESSDEWYEVPPDVTAREPTSATVVGTVAAVTGTDPESLRPLYDVVDPDALDRLFASVSGATDRKNGRGRVTFRYEGLSIRVFEDGRIAVTPADEE